MLFEVVREAALTWVTLATGKGALGTRRSALGRTETQCWVNAVTRDRNERAGQPCVGGERAIA